MLNKRNLVAVMFSGLTAVTFSPKSSRDPNQTIVPQSNNEQCDVCIHRRTQVTAVRVQRFASHVSRQAAVWINISPTRMGYSFEPNWSLFGLSMGLFATQESQTGPEIIRNSWSSLTSSPPIEFSKRGYCSILTQCKNIYVYFTCNTIHRFLICTVSQVRLCNVTWTTICALMAAELDFCA